MSETIKPCPFCGEKPLSKYDSHWGFYVVTCNNCCFSLKEENSKDTVEERWNRRHHGFCKDCKYFKGNPPMIYDHDEITEKEIATIIILSAIIAFILWRFL